MNLTISCLCGASRQELTYDRPHLLLSDAKMERHGSGVLFVSHLVINPPEPRNLSRLSYQGSEGVKRFFCGTCGCHVFRKVTVSPALASLAHNLRDSQPPTELFVVATGVIVESPDEREDIRYGRGTDDPCDGGLGPWLPIAEMKGRTQSTQAWVSHKSAYNSVPASCRCGNVKLLIQRPQELLDLVGKSQNGIQLPYSPYPDLMFPYKTTPKVKLDNPSDEKWYLRRTGEESRYLAGTCACKSCRLVTGYEIQTWAFIPRVAISISTSSDAGTAVSSSSVPARSSVQDIAPYYIPLDFEVLENLPAGRNPLRSYESSPGVFREFCHGCGATVFWHSKIRPDLIDVSVGLLQASEGARAESLLDWWRDRCSFAEDAGLDRKGWVKDWAIGLIQGLEEGMAWE